MKEKVKPFCPKCTNILLHYYIASMHINLQKKKHTKRIALYSKLSNLCPS